MKKLIGLAALMSAWAAFAQPASVYGLPLGEPVSLPECQKSEIAGMVTYRMAVGGPCVKALPAKMPPLDIARADQAVLISFPVSNPPTGSAISDVSAILVAGKLEGVMVSTAGYQTQEMVFDDLLGKYGKPASVSRLPLSGSGPTLAGGITAEWKTPEVEVLFSGVMGGPNKGFLRIATPAGAAEHERRLGEIKVRRTPL